MKRLLICIAFFSLLLCPRMSQAAPLTSTLKDQQNMAMTIYNSNVGLVKDTRLIDLKPGPIMADDTFQLSCFPVTHRGPDNFGYIFQEKERRPFLVEKAEELGVPAGPERARLVRGLPVTLADGRTIQPEEVLGPSRPGCKFAFVGDASRTDDLVEVLAYLRQTFPEIQRVTTYSRSRTVTRKSLESLRRIRAAGMDRVHIGLDFFDASINRLGAWTVGARSVLKAMLLALLEPRAKLVACEEAGDIPSAIANYEKLLGEAKLLGRIVTISGQWNRAVAPDLGAPARYAIPDARLKQYGFKDMHQFRNWRWYKGLGGGPIVDLGSHQIDIYTWFLGVNPSHVMASGGQLYYDPKTHEWYDTAMVVYDYDTPAGPVKAYYQTQTTNGSQGYFENFMGDQGTLLISESETYGAKLYRDTNAPAWDTWVQKGYVTAPKIQEMKEQDDAAVTDVRESVSPDEHTVSIVLRDPYHQPHLQNFFDAVRGKAKLTCPPEVGFESAVSVLKVNEAIEAKCRLAFTPEDFHV